MKCKCGGEATLERQLTQGGLVEKRIVCKCGNMSGYFYTEQEAFDWWKSHMAPIMCIDCKAYDAIRMICAVHKTPVKPNWTCAKSEREESELYKEIQRKVHIRDGKK